MLTPAEKILLAKVLEVAGTDEGKVKSGVSAAIYSEEDCRGDTGKARRTHLWAVLPNAARRKIRELKRKEEAERTRQRELSLV